MEVTFMATPYRFAIYSQDGMGLGHLRRNTLIGQKILEAAPGSNILLIADSPVAPFFRLPPGMDFIKLPSIQKISPGVWQPTHLQVHEQDVQELRAALLLRCPRPAGYPGCERGDRTGLADRGRL